MLKRNLEFYTVFGNTTPLFGCAAADLPGLNFTQVVGQEARPSWIRRWERVFAGETLCAHERFGADSPACSITVFPVRSPDGEIAFAGGMAMEAAERHLAACIWRAQEAERARLSQLLHDRIGQHLSAAGLQLDLLRMDLEASAPGISPRTAEIQNMLETVMDVVRHFSLELNPAVVERVGLRAALDGLAGRLRSDFQGNVRLMTDPAARPSAAAAAALYRIAREAAANAARHSACSAIEILLKSTRSGPALEIRDNGQGFDALGGAFRGRGQGLMLMEQYAEEAGIDLHIESSPGKGTVVKAMCRSAEGISAG
jgi:signal transduction histidine kinase